MREHDLSRLLPASLALAAVFMLGGCIPLKPYRTDIPSAGGPAPCTAETDAAKRHPVAPCVSQATERNDSYTMHVVEFDDEGWPWEVENANRLAASQTDSAIGQIKEQLRRGDSCVRLFVYVHGWRHNADTADANVQSFRAFLQAVSQRAPAKTAAARSTCDNADASTVQTVGIYVGWRGLSVADVEPLVFTSFWDRKNTADRVSQGSVRELFGRLSALAAFAPANDKARSAANQTTGQLRTYVIGHSFGAAIAFRALSQSLVDSFSGDLDQGRRRGLGAGIAFRGHGRSGQPGDRIGAL
jgi:hypothetical protein